jgi:hypothetical protein
MCFMGLSSDPSRLSLLQRARVGPGKSSGGGDSSSSVCRYDSNGNQDRVKLSDFTFIMVLGKGSFGKVGPVQADTPYTDTLLR